MKLISDDALAIITVYQEARNQSFNGMCAVGEVIRNRMARKYSSDGTMAGTVCRAYQFSGWNTEDPNRIKSLCLDDRDPVAQKCAEAWRASEETTYALDAVLYCNLESLAKRPEWAKEQNLVKKLGDHSFFRDP